MKIYYKFLSWRNCQHLLIDRQFLTAIDTYFRKRTCSPWSHGLRPKNLWASVVAPPAPVRIPSQRPLAPSVTLVTSIANDKDLDFGYTSMFMSERYPYLFQKKEGFFGCMFMWIFLKRENPSPEVCENIFEPHYINKNLLYWKHKGNYFNILYHLYVFRQVLVIYWVRDFCSMCSTINVWTTKLMKSHYLGRFKFLFISICVRKKID